MPYKFFNNAIENGLSQLPNEAFRDRQQAAIDAGFEVTTNRYAIKEQDDIGTVGYHDIDAWIGNAMGLTTRGLANGDDFKTLTFKSLDHVIKKGLYYQFDENTWLTYFTDKHSCLDVTIGIRRCNNVMKMIDPKDGSVFSIPCAIDYDMTAPSMQVTSSVLTPNNHAIVRVQGNADTHRLFKMNTRFIFGGRPFKILAYQNALIDEKISDTPTYLELDLFLDEIHAKDDLENQIADNGEYNYAIEIDAHDMELVSGSTGVLNASVSLNGQEVNRQIVWESLDPEVVTIDNNGSYKVIGQDSMSCDVIAYIEGNPVVSDKIHIAVKSAEALAPKITIEPNFNVLRQYETIKFKVQVSYGSKIYNPDMVDVEGNSQYLAVKKYEDHYEITGLRIAPETQLLKISVQNTEPKFEATYDFSVEVVSMMG